MSRLQQRGAAITRVGVGIVKVVAFGIVLAVIVIVAAALISSS